MERYREPLRTLIGRYESQLLNRRLHKTTSRLFSQRLWHFFSHFPRKSRPDQFDLSDCEDYRQWRQEEGLAYSTIRSELCVVKAFFNWVAIEEEGEFRGLRNPVEVPPWPQPRDSDEHNNLLAPASSAGRPA
jgi:site-specific recombinase XerD